jgi:hypothetical protein
MTGATITENSIDALCKEYSADRAARLGAQVQSSHKFHASTITEFSNLWYCKNNILLLDENSIFQPTAEEVFIYCPRERSTHPHRPVSKYDARIKCTPQNVLYIRIGEITQDITEALGYKNLRNRFVSIYNGRVKDNAWGTMFLEAQPVRQKANRK